MPRDEGASDDRGSSFIEILVAVVLLGIVVVGVLAALRTTVIATKLERDHAKAQQWLQSAGQVIEDDSFGDCRSNNIPQSHTDVLAAYQSKIRADAQAPDGWNPTQLTVVSPIDVWNGAQWIQYTTATDCFDDYGLKLQRITVRVLSPDGDILEEVQVVKSD